MWKRNFTIKIVSLFIISVLVSCNFSNKTPIPEQPATVDFKVAILFGLEEGAQELAPFRGALTPQQAARVNGVKLDIIIEKIDVMP